MKENTEVPNGLDPESTDEGSPVPDPAESDGRDAEDVPGAD